MYYAIGFEEAPGSFVQGLDHLSADSWYDEVAFWGVTGHHSWRLLAKAISELDRDRWPSRRSEIGGQLSRRAQLEPFAMRLLRDVRSAALREPEYLRTATDRAILHRVRLLAWPCRGKPSRSLRKTLVAAYGLLAQISLAAAPLPDREVFIENEYFEHEYLLHWLWLKAPKLLDMNKRCTLATLTSRK